MSKYSLLLLSVLPTYTYAGPYIELGIGVPLTPDTGYMPDSYGIASLGYVHNIDHRVAVDVGFAHRSDTGTDTGQCGTENICNGDNAIEAKLRLEW